MKKRVLILIYNKASIKKSYFQAWPTFDDDDNKESKDNIELSTNKKSTNKYTHQPTIYDLDEN